MFGVFCANSRGTEIPFTDARVRLGNNLRRGRKIGIAELWIPSGIDNTADITRLLHKTFSPRFVSRITPEQRIAIDTSRRDGLRTSFSPSVSRMQKGRLSCISDCCRSGEICFGFSSLPAN